MSLSHLFMLTAPKSIECFSPAKVNLFLAITGLRSDGFHELVSLVAPLAFGDQLTVTHQQGSGSDLLSCSFPDVPTGPENLVLKAAAKFRENVTIEGHFCFNLEKKIPAGAGLGGGSSNAATALRAMNELIGSPLSYEKLCEIAAELGSDCPLFIDQKATVMSGRGENLEQLPENVLQAISGKQILLFRPDFGISTPWAYGKMKSANGRMYLPEAEAREKLESWLGNPVWENLPLVNNMQDAAFSKYLALPVLLQMLQDEYSIPCMMSGSGSCCFAIPSPEMETQAIKQKILEAWGNTCFYAETSIL